MKNPQRDPDKFVDLDGVIRNASEAKRLNDAFAACFRDIPGQVAIDYLRQHVLPATGPNRILPTGAILPVTDAELWHREGQRFILAMIEARIRHGRDGKPEIKSE